MTVDDAHDDKTLLAAITSGDRHAFSMLVERHSTRFFRVAFRTVGNVEDAEDIVQEAFVNLWKNPGSWDAQRGVQFTTWFYRVVMNRAFSLLKSRHHHANIDIAALADCSPSTEQTLSKVERRKWLEAKIQALPKRQQMALNLCVFEECKNQQAADILGISLKALESLLSRARATLRQLVQKQQEVGKQSDG